MLHDDKLRMFPVFARIQKTLKVSLAVVAHLEHDVPAVGKYFV